MDNPATLLWCLWLDLAFYCLDLDLWGMSRLVSFKACLGALCRLLRLSLIAIDSCFCAANSALTGQFEMRTGPFQNFLTH